jgi:hypothetical protein
MLTVLHVLLERSVEYLCYSPCHAGHEVPEIEESEAEEDNSLFF